MSSESAQAETPQEACLANATIRIPGTGGATFILRPVPISDRWPDREVPRMGLDITLADPGRVVTYRDRPMTEPDLRNLADFLHRAMAAPDPHVSTGTFTADETGLLMSIPTSDSMTVDLLISVVTDPATEVKDFDQMRFTTNRAALWGAVEAARRITGQHAAQSAPAWHIDGPHPSDDQEQGW